jgi:hypothetical protein
MYSSHLCGKLQVAGVALSGPLLNRQHKSTVVGTGAEYRSGGAPSREIEPLAFHTLQLRPQTDCGSTYMAHWNILNGCIPQHAGMPSMVRY